MRSPQRDHTSHHLQLFCSASHPRTASLTCGSRPAPQPSKSSKKSSSFSRQGVFAPPRSPFALLLVFRIVLFGMRFISNSRRFQQKFASALRSIPAAPKAANAQPSNSNPVVNEIEHKTNARIKELFSTAPPSKSQVNALTAPVPLGGGTASVCVSDVSDNVLRKLSCCQCQ